MAETTQLTGKIALVTGSSRGIGRAAALELARRGANVVINYAKSSGPADETVNEIKAMGRDSIAIQADVSQPAEIIALFEKAIAHFGHLDICVSMSGVESFGHVSTITADEFDRVFHINTRGQLLVAGQAYKHLNENGRLVMISSISAQSKSVPNHAVYAGSKAAVEAFARCLAIDFGDKKITVNAVAPGGIMTDMAVEVAHEYTPNRNNGVKLTKEELEKNLADLSPLKKIPIPDDVARVIAFLCSEDGRWMNGQTLTVAGGSAL